MNHPKNGDRPLSGKRPPNLDQGRPMARPRNSPSPLPKQKRANLDQTQPMAKARNRAEPYAKNSEMTTYRKGPSSSPFPMPEADRIRGELMRPSHPQGHSRKGR